MLCVCVCVDAVCVIVSMLCVTIGPAAQVARAPEKAPDTDNTEAEAWDFVAVDNNQSALVGTVYKRR